jgi:hypothetical protein
MLMKTNARNIAYPRQVVPFPVSSGLYLPCPSPATARNAKRPKGAASNYLKNAEDCQFQAPVLPVATGNRPRRPGVYTLIDVRVSPNRWLITAGLLRIECAHRKASILSLILRKPVSGDYSQPQAKRVGLGKSPALRRQASCHANTAGGESGCALMNCSYSSIAPLRSRCACSGVRW